MPDLSSWPQDMRLLVRTRRVEAEGDGERRNAGRHNGRVAT